MLKRILFKVHSSLSSKFAVLDYSGTHSLNAHTNCISNFNIRNRLFALTSFARQSLATLYRKSAFTLAETLIVMGIIGVVAALTLPNLNSSTGDKEKVAKVKKIYQNLNDAFGRAQTVYGPFDEWFNNDSQNADYSKRFATRLTEFMKVSKDCAFDTSGKCFTTKDKIFYGNSYSENNYTDYNTSEYYKFILADGTAISLCCTKTYCFINFDIDGVQNGASSWGKDLFVMRIESINIEKGVYPVVFPDGYNPCGIGFDCAAWIIMNDNADYLKTSDGKTCPNGKVLSWGGNTTCK